MDNIYWPFDTTLRKSTVKRIIWHFLDQWNFAAAKRVREILASERPDLVHTNNLTGYSVAVWREARKFGLPIVHTLRDYSLLCIRATLFRGDSSCEKRCAECKAMSSVKFMMSDAVSEVCANSRFVLDIHRRFGIFVKKPGHVVFNIVDMPETSEPLPPRQIDAPVTFGFIGKLDVDKGIEVVLASTKLVEHENWRLVVAGNGVESYVSDLKTKYPDPRIVWLGFASSTAFFRMIDVALISSIWYEPLPRTLIEAIAHGCPAICADSGGIPEIWGMCDLVGTYQPADAKALAALMDTTIARGATLTKKPPDRRALDVFSEDAVCGGYLDIYRSALEGSRSAKQ